MNRLPRSPMNPPDSAGRVIAAIAAGWLLVALIALAVDRLTTAHRGKTSDAGWIDPASLSTGSLVPPSHQPPTPIPPPVPPVPPLPTTQPPMLFLTPAGRSPLLQTGEVLERPLPYAKRSASTKPRPLTSASNPSPNALQPPASPTADEKIISWPQAVDHIGQTMTVQGKITQTYLSTANQLCFLNFTSKRQGAFFVIIFPQALSAWGLPPDELFKGKTIRVTGTIFQYQDRTQIRVYEKEQIQIVDP